MINKTILLLVAGRGIQGELTDGSPPRLRMTARRFRALISVHGSTPQRSWRTLVLCHDRGKTIWYESLAKRTDSFTAITDAVKQLSERGMRRALLQFHFSSPREKHSMLSGICYRT